VLQAVRQNVRGLPVDVPLLNKYVADRGGPIDYLKTAFPPYLSNQILHPQQPNWLLQGTAHTHTHAHTFPRGLICCCCLCVLSSWPGLPRCVWQDHAGVPLTDVCPHGRAPPQGIAQESPLEHVTWGSFRGSVIRFFGHLCFWIHVFHLCPPTSPRHWVSAPPLISSFDKGCYSRLSLLSLFLSLLMGQVC